MFNIYPKEAEHYVFARLIPECPNKQKGRLVDMYDCSGEQTLLF